MEVDLPSRPVIFLDDGGVLNDNRLRGTQWQRMVGEFFVPRLGGTPEAWAEANRALITSMLAPDAWRERMLAAPDYATFDYKYQLDWLYGMCELVGVPPPSEKESVALARQASAAIIPRVDAAFPGVVETIRLLHNRGYTLHTASGASSTELDSYLDAMSVRDCFGRLYGPDLIETFKNGPEFHERILADACVAPSDALILDDNPIVVGWIKQVGARAVLVGDTSGASTEITNVIASLADLPRLIEQLY